MRKEFHYLLTAIVFYTRIPVKVRQEINESSIHGSTKYFPLIGMLVGSLSAGIFWITSQVMPLSVSVLISMAASLFITGAFHEDGFADFCDGFGGAYDPDRILTIMKDSRIGTFGSVGLIVILLTKFFAISHTSVEQIPLIIVAAHTFSRFTPVLLIISSSYVQKADMIKVKPVSKSISPWHVLIAAIFGLSPLMLIHWSWALILLQVSALIFWRFHIYVNKKIGGYTGDVLGALQQLTEVMFYITYLVWQNKVIDFI
ncbi:MAG: adenosylcobinamide-GDP ribazoletransferase [Bacteroidetes bacterium]|jgi:adenosylcobinamide-GDP ribazoletransferase|nr:adenosylcobinamide-GDP ribazoletransferase [Bacteroidota bacterium]